MHNNFGGIPLGINPFMPPWVQPWPPSSDRGVTRLLPSTLSSTDEFSI